MFCNQSIYRISKDLLYQHLIFRHKYEFLHNKMSPDIRITVSPRKIGILLDYENSKLSFFNVDISQHLYTFSCQLHQFVHPCFSLEKPGCLKIHNGISMPKHVTCYQTVLMLAPCLFAAPTPLIPTPQPADLGIQAPAARRARVISWQTGVLALASPDRVLSSTCTSMARCQSLPARLSSEGSD